MNRSDSNALEMAWLPVLPFTAASAFVGLADIFDDVEAFRAAGVGGTDLDALTEPTTMRLLQAVFQAAAAQGTTATRWLRDNRRRFDLFDQNSPFAQNGDLARFAGEVFKPAGVLPLFNAGDGPTLLNHDHLATGTRYTPAQAARLVLARHAFGISGIQPFPAAPYGPGGKNGKAAVCGPRPYLWVDTGSLAGSLAASTVPGRQGNFLFSWPAGATPGATRAVSGQLDVLTWPSRSIALRPDSDGLIGAVAVGNGLVFGDETDPTLLPHTVFRAGKKPGDPVTAVRATFTGSASRRLLGAWVDPGRSGLLAHLAGLPADIRAGWTLRWQGLATFQSRIDGVLDVAMPVPTAPDPEIQAFLEGSVKAYKAAYSVVGTAIRATRVLGVDDEFNRCKQAVNAAMDNEMEHIGPAVAVGALTAADGVERLHAAVGSAAATAAPRFTAQRSVRSLLALEGTR